MAPRSIKGFNSAIQKVEEELTELDQKLQAAEADSTEEEDLIAEKAEKSLKLQQLKDQFEAFKSSGENSDEEEQAEPEEEQAEPEEEQAEPEEEQAEPEEVWPETMYVRARNDIGFMVNPYTHDRINTDFKKVVVDKWVISQVKAGFLLQDKD